MYITTNQKAVFVASLNCEFGELMDVDLTKNDLINVSLTRDQVRFIDLLNDNAVLYAHRILVHNGIPTQVEIDGMSGKIKYRRRLRI